MALGDNFTVTKPDFGKNPLNFFKEVYVELRKVTWPKKNEVIRLTTLVIVVSLLVGFYLGILDAIFKTLVEFVITKK